MTGIASVLGVTAVVAGVVTVLCLPPRATTAPAPAWQAARTVVAGAFHVHTRQSDGTGSIDEVARAAGKAGLTFVVVTDHGDAMRPPQTPEYRSGVLIIDGVEISTTDGHYAAVGLTASPYPLAGEARDVADDVRRLGGFGVAAHGESAKADSRWHDWNAPIDGLEWLNLDSAWRDAPARVVARGLLTYWLRPAETLAAMIPRPVSTLDRLDRLAVRQRTLALATSDAHGRPPTSYEACFRTLSTRVELDQPLTGSADVDASAIVSSLAAGRHYTAIDALAAAPAFEFSGHERGSVVGEGGVLPAGVPVTFKSRVAAPPGAVSVLLRDGVVVHQTPSPSWRYEADGRPAAYRVEVWLNDPGRAGLPVPWIASNPIFVGVGTGQAGDHEAGERTFASLPVAWQAEHDGTSNVAVDRLESSGVRLRYTLGAGVPTNQYAAAAASAPPDLASFRGVRLTARADRPLRLSLMLRADRLPDAPAWQRSIYLDSTERSVSIAFDDLRPVRTTDAQPAPLASIDSILILAGLTNSRPATGAQVDVSEFRFEHRP